MNTINKLSGLKQHKRITRKSKISVYMCVHMCVCVSPNVKTSLIITVVKDENKKTTQKNLKFYIEHIFVCRSKRI